MTLPAITLEQSINECHLLFSKNNLFYGHGTDNALDESVHLVLGVVNKSPYENVINWNQLLTNEQKQTINVLAEQRILTRKPLPYLNNIAYFANYPFYVNEACIIPRSPIAELITNHFQPMLKLPNFNRVLDICSGGGCIGISIALYHDWVEVDMIDIDINAIAIAHKNIHNYSLEARVQVYQSNMFAVLEQENDKQGYDLIVSNPPYVDSIEMQKLPIEYSFEPNKSLQARDNGLEFVHQLLGKSKNFLNDDGILIVEVGNSMQSVKEAYPTLNFTWLDFNNGGYGVFLLHKSDLI